jgi:hypothetical protein
LQRPIWPAALQSAIERSHPSPVFIPEQPINLYAQDICEGFKLVVENVAVIVFDFGDCGSIKLYPESSEPPRKGILR